jgi:stage II sporulation protein D
LRFLLVLLLAGAARADNDPPNYSIQIGIATKAASLVLKPAGKFRLIDPVEGLKGTLAANKSYRLEPLERGLRLGSMIVSPDTRLEQEGTGGSIMVGDRTYGGKLILRLDEGRTVTIIEEVGIEEYLRGVLPYEMDPDWPLEALKAQAVVARTFAYAHLGKFRKAGFDLTSDTRSQVYRGIGRDAESVRRAVAETRGEVLGYKGELLTVYYHACCGGRTLGTEEVWGSPSPPPLRGVKDSLCSMSPHHEWLAYFPAAEFLAAVQNDHIYGGKIESFKIHKRDTAGYAKEFKLVVGGTTLIIPAAELRKRLGNTELRSARIKSVKKHGGGVELIGRGSGHGVGLCQWGARLLAQRHTRYEKILKHYFPGSTLSLVDK